MIPLVRRDGFGELDHAHHCAKDGSCRHPGATAAVLPFEPLWAAARFSSNGEFGAAVGRTARCVLRWKANGVPVSVADEVACRLGLHPVSVWGSDWETTA